MKYMIELFRGVNSKTFMTDSLLEAYEYFFSGKDSKRFTHGHIVDVASSEIFAYFGYND
jgi:hypothetical protein